MNYYPIKHTEIPDVFNISRYAVVKEQTERMAQGNCWVMITSSPQFFGSALIENKLYKH